METLRALSGTDYGTLQVGSTEKIHVPSNVDGVDQKGDYFLWYEIKNPGENLSKGQEILLQALARNPKSIVLILRTNGERSSIGATIFNPVSYERVYPHMTAMPTKCNLQSFTKLRDEWFRAASNANDNAMRFCFDTVEGQWLREMQEKAA